MSIRCFFSNYVAEIIFFLFKVSEAMLEPSVRLYIYKTVCLHEALNITTCSHLSSRPHLEDHVQNLSGTYIMVYKILINVPAMLLGLFCGAWSDHVGRKLPVMLPCLGTVIAVIFYMLSLSTEIPSIELILTGAAVRGLFGKSAVITMALHSYISDTTTKENRTERLGRLLAMNFFGYFAGSLIAGVMMEGSGFHVLFLVVAIINAFCVLITICVMKESIHTDVITKEGKIVKSTKNPFKLRHMKESIDVMFRKRDERNRLHLWIFFLVIVFQQACKSGEVDITLLFVERSPLNWSKPIYGYLLAVDYAWLGISVLFLLPVLSTRFNATDTSLVLIGLAFKVVRLVIMSFSTTTWMVFLSVIVGSPSSMLISGCKSVISKIVDEHEMGKIFSLLSCAETISNLIGSILFTYLYKYTMHIYNGAAFGVDALLFLLALIIMALVSSDYKLSGRYNLLRGFIQPSNHKQPQKKPQEQQRPDSPENMKKLLVNSMKRACKYGVYDRSVYSEQSFDGLVIPTRGKYHDEDLMDIEESYAQSDDLLDASSSSEYSPEDCGATGVEKSKEDGAGNVEKSKKDGVDGDEVRVDGGEQPSTSHDDTIDFIDLEPSNQ